MKPADPSSPGFFSRSSTFLRITLLVIFLLGLGIRLYDLTDPPLDFHSSRQLFSAIIARGIYYKGLDTAPEWQRLQALSALADKPVIEPRIFETLVALTYRIIGQEVLWVARIYSALFWLIGGVGLYFLAREMTSPDGGVIAVLFYVFVPFGALASRSFQPDPLMIMAIILAWLAFYRWVHHPSWKNAILAGLAAGFAMFVKSVAVFMLLGGMAALLLSERGVKKTLKDLQVWVIAGMSALPVGVFTLYGILALGMSSQFKNRFFPEMLVDPAHYVRWANEMFSIVGFSGVILGLVGTFVFIKPSQRAFLIGLWGGYVTYGFFFPYHFETHNYYHLPLIPIVALSISPLAEMVFSQISKLQLRVGWMVAIMAVLILGVVVQLWEVRVELARADYHHEPAYWKALGELIGREKKVVALTQDYGDRIGYYGWVTVENWPDTGLLKLRELGGGGEITFSDWFADHTEGADYFLVTRLNELDRQAELKAYLYRHFALIAEGDGYVLFDLNQNTP